MVVTEETKNRVYTDAYHSGSGTYRCWVCAHTLSRGSDTNNAWNCSHIVPKCKGGSDEYENLRACCRPCNLKCDTHNLRKFRTAYRAGRIAIEGRPLTPDRIAEYGRVGRQ